MFSSAYLANEFGIKLVRTILISTFSIFKFFTNFNHLFSCERYSHHCSRVGGYSFIVLSTPSGLNIFKCQNIFQNIYELIISAVCLLFVSPYYATIMYSSSIGNHSYKKKNNNDVVTAKLVS